jgi:N-acetylglucosaminyl transferase component (Gpi1)
MSSGQTTLFWPTTTHLITPQTQDKHVTDTIVSPTLMSHSRSAMPKEPAYLIGWNTRDLTCCVATLIPIHTVTLTALQSALKLTRNVPNPTTTHLTYTQTPIVSDVKNPTQKHSLSATTHNVYTKRPDMTLSGRESGSAAAAAAGVACTPTTTHTDNGFSADIASSSIGQSVLHDCGGAPVILGVWRGTVSNDEEMPYEAEICHAKSEANYWVSVGIARRYDTMLEQYVVEPIVEEVYVCDYSYRVNAQLVFYDRPNAWTLYSRVNTDVNQMFGCTPISGSPTHVQQDAHAMHCAAVLLSDDMQLNSSSSSSASSAAAASSGAISSAANVGTTDINNVPNDSTNSTTAGCESNSTYSSTAAGAAGVNSASTLNAANRASLDTDLSRNDPSSDALSACLVQINSSVIVESLIWQNISMALAQPMVDISTSSSDAKHTTTSTTSTGSTTTKTAAAASSVFTGQISPLTLLRRIRHPHHSNSLNAVDPRIGGTNYSDTETEESDTDDGSTDISLYGLRNRQHRSPGTGSVDELSSSSSLEMTLALRDKPELPSIAAPESAAPRVLPSTEASSHPLFDLTWGFVLKLPFLLAMFVVTTIIQFAIFFVNVDGGFVKRRSHLIQQIDFRLGEIKHCLTGTSMPVHQHTEYTDSRAQTAEHQALSQSVFGLPLHVWNVLGTLIVDISVGILLGRYLRAHVPEMLAAIHQASRMLHSDVLQTYIHWLMGLPAGMKLNAQLNSRLGSMVLYGIQQWDSATSFVVSFEVQIFIIVTYSSWLGASTLLALASDFLNLITLHIDLVHSAFGRLHSAMVYSLSSLFLLFRGKKHNILRNRIDTCVYDREQLLVGTLLFTVFFFLFPTIAIYYVFFSFVRLMIAAAQAIVWLIMAWFNFFPFFAVFAYTTKLIAVPGGIHFDLLHSACMYSSVAPLRDLAKLDAKELASADESNTGAQRSPTVYMVLRTHRAPFPSLFSHYFSIVGEFLRRNKPGTMIRTLLHGQSFSAFMQPLTLKSRHGSLISITESFQHIK